MFYPSNEFALASIDYTFQLIINYTLLIGILGYFFVTNNYNFFREKFTSAIWTVLIALVIISLALSVNKFESTKFIVAIFTVSMPALLYCREFGAEKLLKSLSYFIIVMAFVNFAYVLALPEYGIMSGNHEGKWRGVFEHKNGAGPFFAIGFFVLLHEIKARMNLLFMLQIFSLAVCSIFIVLSGSATALVMFASLILLYPFMLFLYRFNPGERVALFITLIAILALLVTVLGPTIISLFFELTGRDPTLTGRTDIWVALLRLLDERPIFGFGPGMTDRPEFMERIQGEVGWEVKSSHNSYLDLLVGYGYPMTVLTITLIFKKWLNSLVLPMTHKSVLRRFAIASSLILVLLIYGFAGSAGILSRSMFWLVMVIALSVMGEEYSRLKKNKD